MFLIQWANTKTKKYRNSKQLEQNKQKSGYIQWDNFRHLTINYTALFRCLPPACQSVTCSPVGAGPIPATVHAYDHPDSALHEAVFIWATRRYTSPVMGCITALPPCATRRGRTIPNSRKLQWLNTHEKKMNVDRLSRILKKYKILCTNK